MKTKFNERAHEYHERAFIQRDLASWTGEWLEPEVSSLQGVEFGAGTGHFTKLLVRAGLRINAVDLSPRMLKIGSRMVPQASWLQGNAWIPAEIPLADRIYSSALLQWCQDPVETLFRWRAFLRPRGRLLCGFFVRDTLPELTLALPGAEPFVWRNPKEWRKFFKGAGFEVIRAESSERIYRFENACAVLRYLHDIGSTYTGRFSATALRSAIRSYDSTFFDHDGVPSRWTFFRIECISGVDD